MLLFDPSSIYAGDSLFEQFDADVQDQIHVFLEKAVGILGLAYQLLNRREEDSTVEKDTQTSRTPRKPATLSRRLSETSFSSITRSRSYQRLRWSLRDKKRVEIIIQDFTELNDSIHESIKLWCLSTSIGIDLQHLRCLENDNNSRALGFDVDARLQIATSQNQAIPSSFEFGWPDLREDMGDMKQYEDRFGVFTCDGKPVLVEYRSYSPDSPVSVDLDERTCDLVNKLASLLHQPKELVFRTPCCRGWIRQTHQNRVAFMFEIPEAVNPCPVSLLKILSSGDSPPPSLSQKFKLALKLSRCISQLQLVKWVHESFRSENILFFPNVEEKTAPVRLEDRINLSEPWVLGFEFSRPEMYFSHGHADACLTRDIYRHPDRQQHPTQPFNKTHDIYALGVVLLEIGLWKQALNMERSGFAKVTEPDAIRKYMIRQTRKYLGAKMGEKYQNVVLKCLEGDFGVVNDTKEDLKLQQAFRAQVVDVLQKSADNI